MIIKNNRNNKVVIPEVQKLLLNKFPIYKIKMDHLLNYTDPELYIFYGGIKGIEKLSHYFKSNYDELILKLKKQKILNEIPNDYLEQLIEEVKDSINSYESMNIRNKEFKYQPQAKIQMTLDPEMPFISLEEIEEKFFIEITDISQLRYDLSTKMLNELENILNINPQNSNNRIEINKLGLNLSVSEISLLFRLMTEENLINYKHKTEIYKFIANNFKTEKQGNISEASIKNKFLSPDNTSIKNLDILIVNLRQHLKKM